MSVAMESIEWQCHLCTFINTTKDKCSMCGINRGVTLQNVDVNGATEDEYSAFVKLRSTYENYIELAELDGTDLITCLDHFECQICLMICSPGEGVTLKDCLHTFCRECLAQAVEHSTESEIRCPYRADDYMCTSLLQEREIRALVSTEVYEKYLARSVTEAEQKMQNAFHCKTVNCKGWCFYDEDDYVKIFQCPICRQDNCIECKAIHGKMTCEDYRISIIVNESDRASATYLKKIVDLKEAMNCPKCEIIITKISGCDAITCAACKTEVCWVTRGPRWGPKGRGDITGGCRCNVNGKRCHPKCGNCH